MGTNKSVTLKTTPFAIELSANAYEVLWSVGMGNVKWAQKDIDSIVNGKHTAETLLAHCLRGVNPNDTDTVEGWEEYVNAVESAARR